MHIDQPPCFVLPIHEVGPTQTALVGGKGAHLGPLARIDGTRVPPGFCVTTDAYQQVVAGAPGLADRLDRLSALDVLDVHDGADRATIAAVSAEVRSLVEALPVPDDLAAEISTAVADLAARPVEADGDAGATGDRLLAVRSSATAEDLPTASFAGQHDSFLDVPADAVLDHVRRCWASLFTERAVTYRLRNGIDHRTVEMAVVVQRMVHPHAAGVLFTADPVTSNRRVASVEATFGLGEALVSGLVTPDVYTVRDDAVVTRSVAADEPALTDDQVVDLVRLGRRVEAELGAPQDIEWCLAGDAFHLVQSRPITTLFPVPETDDDGPHVWVSTGHQQMMTDAMKPLGVSMWQLTALRPMDTAGGRLFVDVTAPLSSPASRAALLDVMGRGDPLIRDALETVLDRGFVPTVAEDAGAPAGPPAGLAVDPVETDPAVVAALVERNRESVAALADAIGTKTGTELFDFIVEDVEELKRQLLAPPGGAVIMAGMEASWWLDEKLQEWLGEPGLAATLAQSVPHNVTSEMGLALLDVADVVRPHPEVVALLERAEDDVMDQLPKVPGGQEAHAAIQAYLDAYGMRGAGEIDITRPRWCEQPRALVPMILANVAAFAPGEAARRFDAGRREAEAKAHGVLARLRQLPDGNAKADEAARMIDRLRTFAGYREYPKFGKVSRELHYKRALLAEAEGLVADGALDDPEDAFFLTFDELRDAVATRRVDRDLVERRREAFRAHQALTPPRVLTSEGEALDGSYRRTDQPAGALVGLPVSGGVVEGRARVVHDIATARVEAGDILVTVGTDPSWSPLFVAVAGLVTEVGGRMTHGAVIAREYGLPAVVGVQGATTLIEDGRRIRLDGTQGLVAPLP